MTGAMSEARNKHKTPTDCTRVTCKATPQAHLPLLRIRGGSGLHNAVLHQADANDARCPQLLWRGVKAVGLQVKSARRSLLEQLRCQRHGSNRLAAVPAVQHTLDVGQLVGWQVLLQHRRGGAATGCLLPVAACDCPCALSTETEVNAESAVTCRCLAIRAPLVLFQGTRILPSCRRRLPALSTRRWPRVQRS